LAADARSRVLRITPGSVTRSPHRLPAADYPRYVGRVGMDAGKVVWRRRATICGRVRARRLGLAVRFLQRRGWRIDLVMTFEVPRAIIMMRSPDGRTAAVQGYRPLGHARYTHERSPFPERLHVERRPPYRHCKLRSLCAWPAWRRGRRVWAAAISLAVMRDTITTFRRSDGYFWAMFNCWCCKAGFVYERVGEAERLYVGSVNDHIGDGLALTAAAALGGRALGVSGVALPRLAAWLLSRAPSPLVRVLRLRRGDGWLPVPGVGYGRRRPRRP
jgi:hypothetical protein